MELCFGMGAMTVGDAASLTSNDGGRSCSYTPQTVFYQNGEPVPSFPWPKNKLCQEIWYNHDIYGNTNSLIGSETGQYGKRLWKKCAHTCKNNPPCIAWRSHRTSSKAVNTAKCDFLDSICDYDIDHPPRVKCGLHQQMDTNSGFSTRVTQKTFDQYKSYLMMVNAYTTTITTTATVVTQPGATTTTTTATTTTPMHRSYQLCNQGKYVGTDGNCTSCPEHTWTPARNSAVECTKHQPCRHNEYPIITGLTTHPNVCLAENDDGSCPQGQYRLNVLPRRWITDEYEDIRDENLDNVSNHNITRYNINNESGLANASDAMIVKYRECLISYVANLTDHPACNDIQLDKASQSMLMADNVSYTNIWTEYHSFHLCAEDIPSCDADDTQIESAAPTPTSGRVCEFCHPRKVGDADPVACPNVTRIHAPLECTFPYRYAASQHNMSNTTGYSGTCCRMEKSGTVVSANNTIIWDQLTDIDWLRWDPDVVPDTECTSAKTLWRYNKSCDDYQHEAVVDDNPPIIEPGYATVDGERECTSQHNFSCTYTCSARRCRHYNATVVTGCDDTVQPYGKLIVNKSARSDLVTTCRKCLLEEYTTATSTTIAGAPATTIAAVSPPTRSPKRRYIYVGLMATAIIAWCFIFSTHD